jgi:hypothetical protein
VLVGASLQCVRVFSGCQSPVGASFEYEPVFRRGWKLFCSPLGSGVSSEFWRQGKQPIKTVQRWCVKCGCDASTGLCVVDSLALLLYLTQNRTSAPAHRLSSVSPIYRANLKLKTGHTLACAGCKRLRIENILCSFEWSWFVVIFSSLAHRSRGLSL